MTIHEKSYQSSAARVAIVGAGPAGSLLAIALLDAAESRRRPVDVTLYHAGTGAGASRGPLLLDAEALSLLSSFGVPLVGRQALPLSGSRVRVGRDLSVTRRMPLFAASRQGPGDFSSSLREMAVLLGAALHERPVEEIHKIPGGHLLRAGGASSRVEAVILACGAGPLLASRLPGHVPPPLWRGCAAELDLDEEGHDLLSGWSTWIPGGPNHPDLAISWAEGRPTLLALGESVEPADLGSALLAAVASGRLPPGLEPRGARRVWLPAGVAIPGLPCVGHALGGAPDGWGLADAARQAQELAAAWFDGGPEAMLAATRAEAHRLGRRWRNRAVADSLWKLSPVATVERAVRYERKQKGPEGGAVQKALAKRVSPPLVPSDVPSLLPMLWAFVVLLWTWFLATFQAGSPTRSMGVPVPGGKVFVVDDDRDQADAICTFLEGRGIACVPFYDGLRAVAAAGRERPAAVVLDVALPWLDGPTICRALQQTGEIPVYLTTALPLALAREQAAAAGGVKVFSKPLDLQELAVRLQEHVRQEPPGPKQRFPRVPTSRVDAVQPPA